MSVLNPVQYGPRISHWSFHSHSDHTSSILMVNVLSLKASFCSVCPYPRLAVEPQPDLSPWCTEPSVYTSIISVIILICQLLQHQCQYFHLSAVGLPPNHCTLLYALCLVWWWLGGSSSYICRYQPFPANPVIMGSFPYWGKCEKLTLAPGSTQPQLGTRKGPGSKCVQHINWQFWLVYESVGLAPYN